MPSDCRDLARRIAIGLRVMADMIEDPIDTHDATEPVDHPDEASTSLLESLPSEAPIEPPIAAAPSEVHAPWSISLGRLKAITGFTADELRNLAALPAAEFEKAQSTGFVKYLRGPTEVSSEAHPPPAAGELLEAAE